MAAGLLFFFSGATGLVYEVLWFRLFLLELGGTGLSVAAVTAAFMAGLGAGAWWLGNRIAPRMAPLRLYGLLEIAIGIYALIVPTLIRLAGGLDALLLGPEPGAAGRAARFFIAGAVLIPATFCMGGTLPVLARLITKSRATPGRFVGMLYGLNTLGAVLGAGATGFFLLPTLGLKRAMGIAAATNVLLGVTAIVLSRGSRAGRDLPSDATVKIEETPRLPRAWLALLAAAAAGLVGFVLQVSWTRILALVFGSSVYAFSLILVLFLFGLGAGALAGSYVAGRVPRAPAWLAWCFVGVGATVLAGETWFGHLPVLYLESLLTSGVRSSLGGAAWLAAAVLLPPTLLLGAAFPFVVRLATGDRGAAAAAGVGRLYAANTAGGVVGAWTAALFLIPSLGLMGTVSASAFAALGVGGLVAALPKSGEPSASFLVRWAPAGAALLAVAGWAAFVPAWDKGVMTLGVGLWGPHAVAQGRDVRQNLRSLSSDGILYYSEGVTATVVVKEAGPAAQQPGQRYLSVDGHIEASDSGDMPTQVLSGQVPLLATRKKNPSVLVVGYASGVTVGSILTHDPSSVTVVEIEKEVITAGGFFDHVNGRPLTDLRVQLVVDDARAYLTRTNRRFDVITSEPSSVWLTGPAKLFTAEMFRIIRDRLEPGGIAGEWVSSYDLTPEDILTVVRTFRSVFPHVAVVQMLAGADLLLLGSEAPIRFDLDVLAAAAANPRIRTDFERIRVTPICGVLDRVAGEPEAVARNVPAGPLNTDDNAWLEYRGARTRGTLGERAALAQLGQLSRGPAAMVIGFAPGGPRAPERLAAACLDEGAARAAASLADWALASGPNAEASWVAGEALRAQAQRVEALERFADALRASPAHVPSAISAALTLQEMDRLTEAITAWDRAQASAPSDALIPAWRGVARLESGDPARALDDFRTVRAHATTQQAPIPLDLYEGRALQEIGRDDEARQVLERAVEAYAQARDGGTEAVAATERLARILAGRPEDRARAEQLARTAAAARERALGEILGGALQIEDSAGADAARAYLRGLMRMDPALRVALERAAAGAPERVRERVVGLVAGVVLPFPAKP